MPEGKVAITIHLYKVFGLEGEFRQCIRDVRVLPPISSLWWCDKLARRRGEMPQLTTLSSVAHLQANENSAGAKCPFERLTISIEASQLTITDACAVYRATMKTSSEELVSSHAITKKKVMAQECIHGNQQHALEPCCFAVLSDRIDCKCRRRNGDQL